MVLDCHNHGYSLSCVIGGVLSQALAKASGRIVRCMCAGGRGCAEESGRGRQSERERDLFERIKSEVGHRREDLVVAGNLRTRDRVGIRAGSQTR
eukprot:2155525-Pleurochrysis_carterae.AAC.3